MLQERRAFDHHRPRLNATATARVLVPAARARFGVISDIDDTIVQTKVTRKVRMIVSLALSSARTRKPFPGVAAFYRALHAGVNPVFYVSNSPYRSSTPLSSAAFRAASSRSISVHVRLRMRPLPPSTPPPRG